MLEKARVAIAKSRIRRVIRQTHDRLGSLSAELEQIEGSVDTSQMDASGLSVNTYVRLTLQSVSGSLLDLERLTEAMSDHGPKIDVCRLLGCPRLAKMTDALLDTVDVLEQTKRAFRSKELGQLRQRLERVLTDVLAEKKKKAAGVLTRTAGGLH